MAFALVERALAAGRLLRPVLERAPLLGRLALAPDEIVGAHRELALAEVEPRQPLLHFLEPAAEKLVPTTVSIRDRRPRGAQLIVTLFHWRHVHRIRRGAE
jgi:hypothetical protein